MSTNFDKFTKRSQEALMAAQQTAVEYKNSELVSLHLLSALFYHRMPATPVAAFLGAVHGSPRPVAAVFHFRTLHHHRFSGKIKVAHFVPLSER